MTDVPEVEIRFLVSEIPRFPSGHFQYHGICPTLRVGSGIRDSSSWRLQPLFTWTRDRPTAASRRRARWLPKSSPWIALCRPRRPGRGTRGRPVSRKLPRLCVISSSSTATANRHATGPSRHGVCETSSRSSLWMTGSPRTRTSSSPITPVAPPDSPTRGYRFIHCPVVFYAIVRGKGFRARSKVNSMGRWR
jgi:hypothetical protein